MGGSVTIFLLFLINAIFRGAGDAALAMRALWFANLINIVLDPCLINGWGPFPRLNVMGASVATTTGRGLGVLFQLWLLFGGYSRVRVYAHQIRINVRDSLAAAARLVHRYPAVPDCHRKLDRAGPPLRHFRQRAGRGLYGRDQDFHVRDSAVLGTVEFRRHPGGPEPGREKAGARRSRRFIRPALYDVLHGLDRRGVPVVRPALAAFLYADPAVQTVAADCLRFISVGNICYAWGMVLVQAFNGAGDTRTPSMINFFCYWCFQIPLAWTWRWFCTGDPAAFSWRFRRRKPL